MLKYLQWNVFNKALNWVILFRCTLLFSTCTYLLIGCQSQMQPKNSSVLDDASTKTSIETTLSDVKRSMLEGHLKQPNSVKNIDRPAQELKVQVLGDIQDQISTDLENRFDISVSNMPARDFFLSLVVGTQDNVILHNDVSGEISISLKSVTLDQLMEAIETVYGYNIEKRSYGYNIYPFELVTEVYNLNYLDVKRVGLSATAVNSGEISSHGSETESSLAKSSQVETQTETDFWEELQQIITTIVGDKEGRSVVINAQSGTVVVRASPKEHVTLHRFLDVAERNLKRQVVIEAKILEVELSDSSQSGINWGLFNGDDSGSATFNAGVLTDSLVAGETADILNVAANQVVSTNGIEGIFSVAFDMGDFKGIIELLKTQGEVHVLSSPRISTVNNQKAVIKVGTDEFFVTEFRNNTTTAGDDVVTSPEFTLTPFFSGIALDVTPQIGDGDEIVLHIHPSVTEVRDQNKVIELFNDTVTLPLALSTIRESDSIVKATSEQIIVIGGLLQSRSENTEAVTPVLGDLPVVGRAFRQVSQEEVKSELVILLKPVITGDRVWSEFLPERKR